MIEDGLYVIFEGNEGTGKSSAMHAVAEHFRDKLQPILTQHPGSTSLGAHLRKLVKYPESIDPDIKIDPLSRQCLYMADTINFLDLILLPSLKAGKTVFADRSTFISGLVYGIVDKVDHKEMYKLLQLVNPPKANRLYVLTCPWQKSKNRIKASRQGDNDHYDNQPEEFFESVNAAYEDLLVGTTEQLMMVSRVASLDNVVHINADQPQVKVIDDIICDLNKYLSNK